MLLDASGISWRMLERSKLTRPGGLSVECGLVLAAGLPCANSLRARQGGFSPACVARRRVR